MTKRRNLAQRIKDTDSYILSTFPSLWVPMTEGHHSDGASFLSSDGIGHVCTVTGALWTPQGRSFDGTDDYLSLSDGSSLDFTTGDFSFLAWINADTYAAANRIILKGTPADTGWSFYIDTTNLNLSSHIGAAHVTYGAHGFSTPSGWHQVGFTRSGGAATVDLIVDGQIITATAKDTPDPVSAASEVTLIGTDVIAQNRYWFDGSIGEIIAKKLNLSPIEIQQNYLATKWRYQ